MKIDKNRENIFRIMFSLEGQGIVGPFAKSAKKVLNIQNNLGKVLKYEGRSEMVLFNNFPLEQSIEKTT